VSHEWNLTNILTCLDFQYLPHHHCTFFFCSRNAKPLKNTPYLKPLFLCFRVFQICLAVLVPVICALLYMHLLFSIVLLTIIISVDAAKKEYNIAEFSEMCSRQKTFVLKTWLVQHAWVNPSMILDPIDNDKIVMVWRVPDSVSYFDFYNERYSIFRYQYFTETTR